MTVPVIDLFAGPGGLSEGFENYRHHGGKIFRCVLSVEKERFAHQTLLLRAFLRQFKRVPKAYYAHARGELSLAKLYWLYPKQYRAARSEAIRLTLAWRNRDRIDILVRNALRTVEDNWVLIGGPPCQAYSIVGRARRLPAERRALEKTRMHYLYKEYLRILKKFKPLVFVMENVKGLLSSSAKSGDIFERMLKDFRRAGYSLHSFVRKGNGDPLEATDYVIEAERFDIPQTRHRVILLGVRKGIERGSRCLREAERLVPIHSAIDDLPRIRSRVSRISDKSFERWARELRRLRSIFTRSGQMRRLRGRWRALSVLNGGDKFIRARLPNRPHGPWLRRHRRWFIDRRLNGVTLHEARRHMSTDLRRYLFASHHAQLNGVSPKIADFPPRLRPAHENIKEAVEDGLFDDRFRVQVRDKPSTTVVSHISKDGHYYIHYDPTQCRSLTVREVARIQTFPDNYLFCGPRTEQYVQVGNAVPPLLARQLAAIVHQILRQAG